MALFRLVASRGMPSNTGAVAVVDEAFATFEESITKGPVAASLLSVLTARDSIFAALPPEKPAADNLELIGCAASAVAGKAFGAVLPISE